MINRWLFFIILLGLVLRLINLGSPFFTSDEANISYRAYTLSTSGKDELGRSFPLIFNSSQDYQLPVVSYLETLSIRLIGDNDLGQRLPFILISICLIPLVFQISKIFSDQKSVWLGSSLIASLSPPLIFLSKVPSDAVLLTTLFTLLFFLLTRKKINLLLTLLTSLILVLTSKDAWFTLPIFTIVTLYFFQKKLSLQKKAFVFLPAVFLGVISFIIFLRIPDGKRSLLENNFSLFSDITIQNGLNMLRGETVKSGVPSFLGKILFSKLHFLFTGLLFWLTNLSLGNFFGEVNTNDAINFPLTGIFEKALILPFLLSIPLMVKEKRLVPLIIFPLILTSPLIFQFPQTDNSLLLTTIPFLAIFIAIGANRLNKFFTYLVLTLVFLELGFKIFIPTVPTRAYNNTRPTWVSPIISDINKLSSSQNIAVEDSIIPNITPYILRSNPSGASYQKPINYPYKYRPTNIKNIQLFNDASEITECNAQRIDYVFINISSSDQYKFAGVTKIRDYRDSFGKPAASLLKLNQCTPEND